MKKQKKKNIYASALKYEAMYNKGVEAICLAIDPNIYVTESTAWCWIEENENDKKACKEMLKKIGY